MQRGSVQPAPGINGAAAGRGGMHAYEWALLSQSVKATPLALTRMWPVTANKEAHVHAACGQFAFFILSSRRDAKPDRSRIDSVWFCINLHLMCPSKSGVRETCILQPAVPSASQALFLVTTYIIITTLHSISRSFIRELHNIAV